MAKATDKREYMNMLWDSSENNDGVFHNTVMDMAWSLHVIAEMLMEQNGYINATEYMVGKPEHVAEQDEPNCSEKPNNSTCSILEIVEDEPNNCPYYPCAVWDEMAFTRERSI